MIFALLSRFFFMWFTHFFCRFVETEKAQSADFITFRMYVSLSLMMMTILLLMLMLMLYTILWWIRTPDLFAPPAQGVCWPGRGPRPGPPRTAPLVGPPSAPDPDHHSGRELMSIPQLSPICQHQLFHKSSDQTERGNDLIGKQIFIGKVRNCTACQLPCRFVSSPPTTTNTITINTNINLFLFINPPSPPPAAGPYPSQQIHFPTSSLNICNMCRGCLVVTIWNNKVLWRP